MASRQRSRTGCITCRVRRVKCDEAKPACTRCVRANVECAGYPRKRRIKALCPEQNSTSFVPATTETSNGIAGSLSAAECTANGRDGVSLKPHRPCLPQRNTPLVGMPSNPQPQQLPCRDAKLVLGYNQFLFRTLHILFPPNELEFWRDELCASAWGCEYLFLTMTALGSLHRAALLLSMPHAIDRTSGLDLKLTAAHVYTQALQELSLHLTEAKKSPRVLIAVLCFMAYFECLGGSMPAFSGHVHAATYYMMSFGITSTSSYAGPDSTRWSAFLQTCIQRLQRVCRVALPFLHRSVDPRALSPPSTPTVNAEKSSIIDMNVLRNLCDLVSSDADVEDLIWRTADAHCTSVLVHKIEMFENILSDWRAHYELLLPELNSDSALNNTLIHKWDRFSMPPMTYSRVSPCSSLVAAHYNFYMARLKWASALLSTDRDVEVLSARFYFYETLRFVRTYIDSNEQPSLRVAVAKDACVPCEALDAGALALLHVTGLCSPGPQWLRWIRDQCDHIVQEGVFKGDTFATNLDCYYTFSMRDHASSPANFERFPDLGERVFCQLIPETDGRHFTSYFFQSVPHDYGSDAAVQYRILGHARWKHDVGKHPCEPSYHYYDDRTLLKGSIKAWLNTREVGIDWNRRSGRTELVAGDALQDHINGTRLLQSLGEAVA